MCTRKVEVKIQKPENNNLYWKIPKQLINKWEQNNNGKMLVKCGQCYECKTERARNWTYKIWLESLSHKEKCFITLTYKDDDNGKKQVSKEEIQDFIKKLRKHTKKKIKYFAAGEYGEKRGRPHYHIIILGWQPDDIKKMRRKSNKGKDLYTSKTIKELWGKGIITIQTFNKNEIGYLTLYINNNRFINEKINHQKIWKKKQAINKLQEKYGIVQKYRDKTTQTIKYRKIKKIKDLEPEEHKNYKKEYKETIYKMPMKFEPEFNLFSKGMGFENYIQKEYWKYDLIIDGYTYERPKDYLRKIIENEKQYKDEIIEATVYELLSRKEYAEDNYINTEDYKEMKKIKAEEQQQKTKNFNRIKENKHVESDF